MCRESPRLHPIHDQSGGRAQFAGDSDSQSQSHLRPKVVSARLPVRAVAWVYPSCRSHPTNETDPAGAPLRRHLELRRTRGHWLDDSAWVQAVGRSGSCIRRYGIGTVSVGARGSGCRSRQASECSGFGSVGCAAAFAQLREIVGNGPKRRQTSRCRVPVFRPRLPATDLCDRPSKPVIWSR